MALVDSLPPTRPLRRCLVADVWLTRRHRPRHGSLATALGTKARSRRDFPRPKGCGISPDGAADWAKRGCAHNVHTRDFGFACTDAGLGRMGMFSGERRVSGARFESHLGHSKSLVGGVLRRRLSVPGAEASRSTLIRA